MLIFPADSFPRTRAGFGDPRVGLLGAQVFTHHLLQRAHEHGDEAVDVAGVKTAGRLQDHQCSCETKTRGKRE